jgi:mannose-6-phosphate isomerase-like protein (cupin superfamily)
MAYRWADAAGLAYTEREAKPDEVAGRLVADLTPLVELKHSRARLWRYPAHTTGRRHRDHAQEEVFVVISGTMTMLLGDEPERVDLGPGSIVAVEPMTALQVRNESDAELVMFIYGSPPLNEGADWLDDVELPAPTD